MNSVAIKKRDECCGCSACYSVCPHEAIVMSPDGMGFLYPKVDENKCVDCGLCSKVCPFENPEANEMTDEFFAGYSQKEQIIFLIRQDLCLIGIWK